MSFFSEKFSTSDILLAETVLPMGPSFAPVVFILPWAKQKYCFQPTIHTGNWYSNFQVDMQKP